MLRTIVAKYNRFGGVGLIKWLIAAIRYYFYRSVLKQKYLERKIFDFKLSLDLSDLGISRQLVINGMREEQLRHVLKEEIKEGMTILDIGANIGYYPLMEGKLAGESGFIYAVEPALENYQLLVENIRLNNLSHIFQTYHMGISNRIGKEKFFLSSHSNLHTFIKEGYKDDYVTAGTDDSNTLEIDVTDLTTFLQDKKAVNLIRMDVEGYEVEIIEGLEGAIKKGLFDGKIVFECHFPKYDNEKHSIRKGLEMLFKYDYHVKTMTSNDEKVSKIRDFGYEAERLIRTGKSVYQGIYRNIANGDAITLISELGGVRDVLLVKENYASFSNAYHLT